MIRPAAPARVDAGMFIPDLAQVSALATSHLHLLDRVERIAAELELGATRPADAAQVLRLVAAQARHA
ncbi:hypothetical protein [Paracoccus aeridis]|uniref:hypothetical protein n=1 Tax=Paracoccus aeridis TaxID=1966466 RepID=UPI00117F5357|nr:hypothetical protein [Paracoccus aeridis]